MTIQNSAAKRWNGQNTKPLVDGSFVVIVTINYLEVVEANYTNTQ